MIKAQDISVGDIIEFTKAEKELLVWPVGHDFAERDYPSIKVGDKICITRAPVKKNGNVKFAFTIEGANPPVEHESFWAYVYNKVKHTASHVPKESVTTDPTSLEFSPQEEAVLCIEQDGKTYYYHSGNNYSIEKGQFKAGPFTVVEKITKRKRIKNTASLYGMLNYMGIGSCPRAVNLYSLTPEQQCNAKGLFNLPEWQIPGYVLHGVEILKSSALYKYNTDDKTLSTTPVNLDVWGYTQKQAAVTELCIDYGEAVSNLMLARAKEQRDLTQGFIVALKYDHTQFDRYDIPSDKDAAFEVAIKKSAINKKVNSTHNKNGFSGVWFSSKEEATAFLDILTPMQSSKMCSSIIDCSTIDKVQLSKISSFFSAPKVAPTASPKSIKP